MSPPPLDSTLLLYFRVNVILVLCGGFSRLSLCTSVRVTVTEDSRPQRDVELALWSRFPQKEALHEERFSVGRWTHPENKLWSTEYLLEKDLWEVDFSLLGSSPVSRGDFIISEVLFTPFSFARCIFLLKFNSAQAWKHYHYLFPISGSEWPWACSCVGATAVRASGPVLPWEPLRVAC